MLVLDVSRSELTLKNMNPLLLLILSSDEGTRTTIPSDANAACKVAADICEAGRVPLTWSSLYKGVHLEQERSNATPPVGNDPDRELIKRFLPHCDAVVTDGSLHPQDWRVELALSLNIPLTATADVHRLLTSTSTHTPTPKAA